MLDEVSLIEVIGRGTYGTVHRGVWKGTIVAVKVLHSQNTSGFEATQQSLLQYVRIMTQLIFITS